jgi:hypothetical protein
VELIAKYGREDLGTGSLLNHSPGGEGHGGWRRSEERQKEHSERMKRYHADPTVAAANSALMKKLHNDPVFAAAASERFKKLHADPVFAAAHSARVRARYSDPVFAAEHSARASKNMKKLHADPVFAAANAKRARETMKKLNSDPVFAAARNKRLQIRNSDPVLIETNIILSREKTQKYHADRRAASNNPSAAETKYLMRKAGRDSRKLRNRNKFLVPQ